MVTEFKIDGEMLTTEGRGESRPIAANNSAEGKAQNKRVEFIFKAEAYKYQKSAAIHLQQVLPVCKAKFYHQPSLFYDFKRWRALCFCSKQENNNKENFLRIELKNAGGSLKPDTYNFKETNEKNPMYGTKKYPEIIKTKAVLYYGAAKNYSFPFTS